jgi:hypothetical protein
MARPREQPCDDGDACTENDMETCWIAMARSVFPVQERQSIVTAWARRPNSLAMMAIHSRSMMMETILDCDGDLCAVYGYASRLFEWNDQRNSPVMMAMRVPKMICRRYWIVMVRSVFLVQVRGRL